MSDTTEKQVKDEAAVNSQPYQTKSHDEEVGIVNKSGQLHTDLKGRHMQMIAIGGAIGAGLFIGSGSALYKGGPAALIIGYFIVGIMLLFTMQALAELAVLYPVNGAFYTYVVRFVDPSWGFAMGWDYAIAWLTVLPFELIAAGITIEFWRPDLNVAIWVTVFLVILTLIQVFGVRGYGEVEFILSMIKIAACTGFIILGIVINCGGVGNRGYIGGKYWYEPGAFKNGFNGFAGVFVVAAFAFGGTELVGLAAAESSNPRQAIPKASKQVFFRIAFFYIINLLILGLILPSDDARLKNSSGANSSYSPFVLAIQDAGIAVLPSIFNAVITISVISVANSCTFGSTRTMQAMAERGMAPKFLAYVDKAGRPLWCVVIQLAFGLLGYIGVAANGLDVFTWLLSLSGLSYFFVWGSCCLAHIRFRLAWNAQGRDLREIPYRTPLGIWGSAIGLFLNALCLIATFYNALYPSPNATPDAADFFEQYLAAPIVIALYLGWKVYSGDWRMWVKLNDIDLMAGARPLEIDDDAEEIMEKKTWKNLPMRIFRALF
ncbi:amino acid permease/ SLC12A domain-containing protein [Annulohypoxylon maeteangense]|uniref:amino acid permease/ SLC12A domain-containing protein n=1 Tax=Annulohypoxylon maeteangense TaxID=1927788 RepID=UPI002007A9F6|nr:amino acid permease/ SLC12A domain-containing protein [Annulohypoxylon maeteangense]KAI0887507.1 amino acid permease/ SLC12A domain-containing protein [Annulohypoxylon maeteangense]